MNLEQLGNLGEFIGSIAVVISLIYVATQLRTNIRVTKADTVDRISADTQNFSVSISENRHFHRSMQQYILKGVPLNEVPSEDRLDLNLLLTAAFHSFLRAYNANNRGYLDNDTWTTIVVLWREVYFGSETVRDWVDQKYFQEMFPASFIKLVEAELHDT